MSFNINFSNLFKEEGISTVHEAEKFFNEQIKLLQEARELDLGADKNLGGISLELRVKELFSDAGFNIIDGRKGYEDFTIEPDENFTLQENVVIEVKSSKSPVPKLDDLRQLDDWVFSLSGEEDARKNGIRSGGLNKWPSMQKHPTPHKGLFIFNGPIGLDFNSRTKSFMHPSQIDFIIKRNFCAVSLNVLIELLRDSKENVWNIIHKTIGEYSST
jgi:hypothetical protein